MAQLAKVKRLTFDAGWMRWGWPERVGGLGGSTLLRAYLGEALTARDLVEPGHLLDDRGAGADDDRLRAARAGGRRWCRGCCAATRRGARASPSRAPAATSPRSRAGRCATDDGWRVTGQKVWTSLAQYAQRCVLLTRTGTPESAHRGITALFVDMDTPGHHACDRSRRCTARPSSARCSSTTSLVPFDRTLGDEGQGWAVAMDLLPYERSTALWHRGAFLHRRLQQLLDAAAAGRARPGRASARSSQLALRVPGPVARHAAPAGGGRARSAPETSIDKVLAGDGRAGGVRPRRRRRWPTRSTLGDDADERALARASSSTRGRRRSTAAAPRSSATSSPAGCSTSGTTDDGRAHDLELFERSLRHATEQHTGDALDAALAELGWHDALVDRPARAVSPLFELQGAANATSSALDHVVAFALGRELDDATLGRAAGDRRWRRARTARRRPASPCAASAPRVAAVERRRGRATAGDGHVAAVVDTADAGRCGRSHGVDPRLGLVEVHGDGRRRRGDTAPRRLGARRSRSPSSRSATSSSARRGRCSSWPASTPLERIQFGQPIAQFQAVRHRLAETLVAHRDRRRGARRGLARSVAR